MSIAIGTHLGRYKVVSPLGAGGMAEVYLAQDMQLGRSVALKLLSNTLAFDDTHLHRFEQEARATSSLNHPNILTIYEIGQIGATHFIATELVEGQTLRQRLKRSRLNLSEALEISIQIAAALSAAHAVGIVHRDIKPENIMVRPDGFIKVLDFGLAKLAEKPTEPGSTDPDAPTVLRIDTEPGAIMGTTRYMSPEQVRGLPLDARTDIWSLGVVLYEMLTGRLPFDGPSIGDVIVSILERQVVPVERYIREVPAELPGILSKALAKDVKERYLRVQDLLSDLRRFTRRHELELELEHAAPPQLGFGIGSKSDAPAVDTAEASAGSLSWSSATSLSRKRRVRRAIDSIAVLPLINASGDPNAEYLSDGITESIINSLSQLPKLRVMARSTVFRYKGKEVDPQQVGFDLGIRAVLMGRVLLLDEDLVIKIELIDVADGSQLWGEQYNRKLADVLAIQGEIATEISEKLRLKLTRGEKKRLTKRYTEKIEAYNLYLKGRYYWNKRTGPDALKGIDYFRKAIETDPNYALAYAGFADSYIVLGAWNAVPSKEAFPKARAAAVKALELDNTLAEAHASLGFFYDSFDWNWPTAEREFKRAIRLKANYATAHEWYALCLSHLGRHEEALSMAKRAQELDPLTPIISTVVGLVCHYARQYERALEEYLQVIEMDPTFIAARYFCGCTYTQLGQHEKAIAEQEMALRISGHGTLPLALLGNALAVSGNPEAAEDKLRELRTLGREMYVSPFFEALIYVGLGQTEPAFRCLEQACTERFHRMSSIKVEPMLDPIRSDSRFADLLRRVGVSLEGHVTKGPRKKRSSPTLS
jgi:serine/threonine-protein kinase